ncbi:MAG: hypothetical protein H7144_01670 [Burkholderiales bacterium]|nr:hypothetical protein [Phycisphaerae bacterium]
MSCWVVPSLAAEFWGISLDHVMSKIHNGEVAAREEHGFTLIDVAPDSPRHERSNNHPRSRPAYPAGISNPMIHESQLPDAVDIISDTIESDAFGDWRSARSETAKLRKGPAALN